MIYWAAMYKGALLTFTYTEEMCWFVGANILEFNNVLIECVQVTVA